MEVDWSLTTPLSVYLCLFYVPTSHSLSSGLDKVRAVMLALEAAGVEFLNHGAPGVRLNPERAMAYAARQQREAEEGLNLRDSPEPGVTTNRRRSAPDEET